jgi:hypothetical protein
MKKSSTSTKSSILTRVSQEWSGGERREEKDGKKSQFEFTQIFPNLCKYYSHEKETKYSEISVSEFQMK